MVSLALHQALEGHVLITRPQTSSIPCYSTSIQNEDFSLIGKIVDELVSSDGSSHAEILQVHIRLDTAVFYHTSPTLSLSSTSKPTKHTATPAISNANCNRVLTLQTAHSLRTLVRFNALNFLDSEALLGALIKGLLPEGEDNYRVDLFADGDLRNIQLDDTAVNGIWLQKGGFNMIRILDFFITSRFYLMVNHASFIQKGDDNMVVTWRHERAMLDITKKLYIGFLCQVSVFKHDFFFVPYQQRLFSISDFDVYQGHTVRMFGSVDTFLDPNILNVDIEESHLSWGYVYLILSLLSHAHGPYAVSFLTVSHKDSGYHMMIKLAKTENTNRLIFFLQIFGQVMLTTIPPKIRKLNQEEVFVELETPSSVKKLSENYYVSSALIFNQNDAYDSQVPLSSSYRNPRQSYAESGLIDYNPEDLIVDVPQEDPLSTCQTSTKSIEHNGEDCWDDFEYSFSKVMKISHSHHNQGKKKVKKPKPSKPLVKTIEAKTEVKSVDSLIEESERLRNALSLLEANLAGAIYDIDRLSSFHQECILARTAKQMLHIYSYFFRLKRKLDGLPYAKQGDYLSKLGLHECDLHYAFEKLNSDRHHFAHPPFQVISHPPQVFIKNSAILRIFHKLLPVYQPGSAGLDGDEVEETFFRSSFSPPAVNKQSEASVKNFNAALKEQIASVEIQLSAKRKLLSELQGRCRGCRSYIKDRHILMIGEVFQRCQKDLHKSLPATGTTILEEASRHGSDIHKRMTSLGLERTELVELLKFIFIYRNNVAHPPCDNPSDLDLVEDEELLRIYRTSFKSFLKEQTTVATQS